MAFFWDFALCSLVEVYRRFRDVRSFHRQLIVLLMNVGTCQKTAIFIFVAVKTRQLADVRTN
jgi:hypothetical protein